MRVVVTTQYWIAVNPRTKIYNQSSVKKLRVQKHHWKRGSLPELIIYQQKLFKLAGSPWLMFQQRSVTRSGEQENGLPHGLSRWLLHSLINALQTLHNTPTLLSKINHFEIYRYMITKWQYNWNKELNSEENFFLLFFFLGGGGVGWTECGVGGSFLFIYFFFSYFFLISV